MRGISAKSLAAVLTAVDAVKGSSGEVGAELFEVVSSPPGQLSHEPPQGLLGIDPAYFEPPLLCVLERRKARQNGGSIRHCSFSTTTSTAIPMRFITLPPEGVGGQPRR